MRLMSATGQVTPRHRARARAGGDTREGCMPGDILKTRRGIGACAVDHVHLFLPVEA